MKGKILAAFLFFSAACAGAQVDENFLKNLHALGRVNGEVAWLKCPEWDWSLIPDECKTPVMISINCLPRCGKWPGDAPDIGAYEYITGITAEKPWGDWTGVPLAAAPGDCALENGHLDYCRDCGPCAQGFGDCDTDEECQPGLTCVQVVNESDYCQPVQNKPSIKISPPTNLRRGEY